jgi:hypothetical protein
MHRPCDEIPNRLSKRLGRFLGAAGAIGHNGNDDRPGAGLDRQAARPILALKPSPDVRRPDRACPGPTPDRSHAIVPHPLGTGMGSTGFSSLTSSPGLDCDTALSELDSQAKRSRKRRPLRAMGSPTEICFRMSKFASSTPTAKNLNFLFASPSWTRRAAFCQESVGPPSVMRNIQGR